MIDFNTEPYNDDYDENKKFYRILYRPSFAVQARELTQMQTILQKQISRHGNAMFKQGAMVIPGQCSVETVTNQSNGADYVTLQVSYNGVAVQTFISALQGATIIGSSGLKATVVKAQDSEGTEPTTLYIRYLNSGDNNTSKVFANNEVIHTDDGIYYFQASSANATGKGSLATITRGVYYINEHFVLVEDQTIVLDKYSNTPSYRVGLQVTESIKSPEQDETLLDNAQNSYNFAAPGAHRYYIELTLSKLAINSTEDLNFIELIRVDEGRIKTIVDKTDYSIIGDTMARRTYDESGDYTVREFGIDVREHRNNNRGQWLQTTAYLFGDVVTNGGNTYVAKTSGTSVTTAPVHTSGTAYDGPGSTGIKWEWTNAPVYNRGIYTPAQGGDESKLAIGIEAGKAYVRGYEIQKDSTTYVPVDKARDYAQNIAAVVQPSVGNYVLVTNVNNLPPVPPDSQSYEMISLRDQVAGSGAPGTAAGSQIGTARVRFLEWHAGATYGSTAIYKLGLFDVQMNAGKDFNRHVKSFYYNVSSGDPNVSFEADISPVLTPLIGSITASSNTITGTGTSFQTDLVVGDYIYANGSLVRISSITDQNTAGATTGNFTGKAFSLATTQLLETQNSSLLFPLPNSTIRSLRTAGTGGINNATYITYQKFTQNASGTTLSLSTSGTFGSASGSTNYIVVDNDITTGGAVIQPVSIVPIGSSVTITLPAGQSGHSMTVIAAVQRTGSAFEKTKTLTSATETFTTQVAAQQGIIYLDKADVFRITSIKMAPGSAFGTTPASSAYTLDISDRYDFDNGQRTTHYDWGSLTLKPSYTVPSNPVQVTYEYFEHGVGDYFDVNSYTNFEYSQIPANLRDSLDFRPRVANKSAGSYKNFISTGSSLCGVPKRGENLTTDYSYYLARRDKIAIDFNGKIFDVKGVSAVQPGDPLDPSQGMIIYNLSLNPYTVNTSDISFTKVDNKRYTMRDIGKLESRINSLEYYTSLSLLETDTQSMKLTDSKGMDRMKNGFVVESFSGSDTIGDPTKVDYYCSIDKENGRLRPFYVMQNVNLLEKNSNNTQRSSSKYQLNGDIITLPIVDTPALITQGYASRLENINPFAIITFLGNVNINPPTDDWFETTTMPDPFINKTEGNYNIIRTLAIASNIISADNNFGTVWGPWRTDWIGVTVGAQRVLDRSNTSVEQLNAIGGAGGGGARRSIVVQNVATATGQSRTGIRTTLKESYSYEQVGERTVSKTVIPYMRSRNVLIQVRGLKPQTRFYGYFDDIDVNSYITPASKLVYTPTNTTKFDTTSNVGGSASETKRRISGDSQVCLNKGDVITTSNNSGSAVVVGKHVDPDTGAYILDVVNVIGTITNGQSFTGSVSGATGTVVSLTAQTTLVTNKNGDINLLFNIPNTSAVRFRTGGKEFKLIDSATSTGSWTSRGRAIYRAEGVLETKQGIVNAVRNADLVKEVVGPNDDPAARQTIYSSVDRVLADSGWYDPLAQSFLVEQKGGAFLTGIDVFFATKDDRIPVTLEIREMVNGYPGKNVLPFSRVTLKPDQVNLSSNLVTLVNGVTVEEQVPTFDTPTRFTFETPVYVQDKGEYAFVLQSDSNNYKVWVSNMGDEIPGTSGRTISQQPYAGSLFKSQNASTWTADQNQDIKFTIYRAQFDTSVVGNVQFVNDVVPAQTIDVDPFQTVSGSNTVRVWHVNHGMYSGSSVTISGVAAAVNGIPASEINGTKIIGNVDKDCYTITTTTSATSSGYAGGSVVKATRNINYDLVNPSIQMQTFSDTNCSFNITTTSGKAIDGTQTPYQADTTYTACLVKEDNYFDSPRVIASEINENTSMGGNKSVTFTCLLSTTNDSVSPVIDTSRASLVAISNIVNYPTEANTNVSALDNKLLFTGATGAYSFTTTGFSSTNSTVRTAMAAIGIGRYVTIASATTAGNNGTFLVSGYTDDGTTGTITLTSFSGTAESAASGTSVTVRELFYDEIAPDGSTTLSSFVTNPIKFANPSTYLRVRFAANIPTEADVLVYYKTCTGDKSQLDTTKYTLFNPDSTVPKVELGNMKFTDIDYTLTGMSAFDTLVVKLVMKSTNSSAIPLIKDLRIISCP